MSDQHQDDVDMDMQQEPQASPESSVPQESGASTSVAEASAGLAVIEASVEPSEALSTAPAPSQDPVVSVPAPDKAQDPPVMPGQDTEQPAAAASENVNDIGSTATSSVPSLPFTAEAAVSSVPVTAASVPALDVAASTPQSAPEIHAPTAVPPNRPAVLLSSGTPTGVDSPTLPAASAPPPPAASTQPSGAAPSKTEQLRQRLQQMPEDGDAWQELAREAERKGDLERTRQVYEDFLKHFPDSGKVWVAYADLELRHGLFPRVEAIFARCLRNSTSIDLWAFYITYIRRMNKTEGVDPEKAKQARNTIIKSYDFCLGHVGQDRSAGQLWNDYIIFLRSSESAGVWEAQQNMDSVRKAYQRAVAIPLNNVEQIWSEYNHWEQQLNKLTAKKFIGERGAAYMTARHVLKELISITSQLPPNDLPRRPDWSNPEDCQAQHWWHRYLLYEEANPLQLDDEVTQLQPRVMFAYRKAFAQARFFPSIWFMGAHYAKNINKPDDALRFLEAGHAANSHSLMASFALAEAYETRRNTSACSKVYDGLIQQLQTALTTSEAARDTRIEAAVQQAKAAFAEAAGRQAPAQGATNNTAGDEEEQSTLSEEIVQLKDDITAQAQFGIEELERSLASAWIAQMRFARRSEGIKQARMVFSRARKAPHLTWQVVEANAMMEYHWNKEPKVATNVFELGLKTFSENIDYVGRYLDFLMATNDDTNARAVLERTVSKVSPQAAGPLWDKWFRYESSFSDLSTIYKLDARLAEAKPSTTPLSRFVDRFSANGLKTMLHQDMGIFTPGDLDGVDSSAEPSTSRYNSPGPKVGDRRGRSPSPAAYERRPVDAKRQRRQSPSPPRRGQQPSQAAGPPHMAAGSGTALAAAQPFPSGPLPPMPVPQSYTEQPAPGKATYNPPARRGGVPSQAGSLAGVPTGPSAAAATFGSAPQGSVPEALMYFMSLLPSSQSFNGAVLPPQDVIDAMSIASLPPPRGMPPPPQPRPGPATYDRRAGQRPMYR